MGDYLQVAAMTTLAAIPVLCIMTALTLGIYAAIWHEDPVCFEQHHIERIELVGEGEHKQERSKNAK